MANAPAQVEDGLDDIWLDWARKDKVRAYSNYANPNERLQFWTHPEVEVDLAAKLNVGAFRMGVDWGRVMPARNQIDVGAIRRYRETLRLVKSKGMKVMLTLWHHDVPKWVQASGGWHTDENKKAFVFFAKRMILELGDDVDWFVTFNEANVFMLMAYTTGAWPPGETQSVLSVVPLLNGPSISALNRMASAHNEIYEWAHKKFPGIQLGLAHNMANYRAGTLIDGLKAKAADSIMNWYLPKQVENHIDFFGMNYYGAEWIKGDGIAIDKNEEYSDAGRAIDVNGLYELLRKVNLAYPRIPILLTENGIADANDSLRPAYLIEHLVAIHAAIRQGVPVKGYFVWTLTDNLEWSDGYCPKFGLAGVNRETFERLPRASFDLFAEIARSRKVTRDQRSSAWNQVVGLQGGDRPMCRAADGASALDRPRVTKFVRKDWRFKSGEADRR